jgi:hypothetical protein
MLAQGSTQNPPMLILMRAFISAFCLGMVKLFPMVRAGWRVSPSAEGDTIPVLPLLIHLEAVATIPVMKILRALLRAITNLSFGRSQTCSFAEIPPTQEKPLRVYTLNPSPNMGEGL